MGNTIRWAVLFAVLLLIAVFILVLPVAAQNPTVTPVPTVLFENVLPTTAPVLIVPTGTGPVQSLSGVGATPVSRNVNIRNGPGTDYSIISVLRAGRSIDVVGTNGFDQTRSCAGDFNATLDMWIVVQFRGQRGWVARCAVVVTGDMSRLLVHPAP